MAELRPIGADESREPGRCPLADVAGPDACRAHKLHAGRRRHQLGGQVQEQAEVSARARATDADDADARQQAKRYVKSSFQPCDSSTATPSREDPATPTPIVEASAMLQH